ncbi:hypothetical protein [Amycolatopsis sp. NPDC051071]|uniref:hypothetical protein n=1 Tax=Amycolatopsis sp. NPDC051071 TaxID=3154637 RepID=UPI00343A988D
MNETHETSNLPDAPGQDINLHECVDDLATIDQMLDRYFTPERLDRQWEQIVEIARGYGTGQSGGDNTSGPALLGEEAPGSLNTSHPGALGESRPLLALVTPLAGTVLAAGAVFPRRAGFSLAQSRYVSRIADRVVEGWGSLTVPGGDLRMMSDGDREETRAVVAEWRELLGACPAGVFGAEGSAMVVGTVAALAEALIADRDEHAALNLVHAVSPHLAFLGHRHPAGFEVRRAGAGALSELGLYRQAKTRLRELSEDEQRVFGSADPRTALLPLWALVGQGRLAEAHDGFRSLEDRLTRSPGADTLLLHVQCRHSWLLGRLGRLVESVNNYARVIVSRTNELGEDHADTLDARHSQQKILVMDGQGAQALSFLQALADDRARVLGDRHPDTLETLKYLHLAHVQAEPGDDRVVARAIRELVEIDRIQRERHGQGHPMLQDTAASLCKLFRGEPISRLRHVPIADEEQSQTIPFVAP